MIVGIDLGTTNSAVAVLTDAGPQLVPNALGDVLTPSIVGVDTDGSVIVGRAARELQVTRPERCVGLFKRYMGSDRKITLADRVFTPEELSSLVLRSLKADAEAHLQQPIDRAVITVPAYFHEHQRKATIHAGQIAGFRVERIFNEPTAAAIAYGFHESREDRSLVVLDLGGGTFDVSVVDFFEGVLEVRASSGENFLGGEDFTRGMVARLLEQRGMNFEHAELMQPLLVSRLLQQCERAKCQLSRQESVTIRIPTPQGELPENAEVVTVSRAQLQAWSESLMARLELPIRRALGDARISPDKVDEVILVGGATRMPQFIARAKQMFGRDPHCRLNPDEVVALGAAVQAGLIARHAGVDDMVVTDVAPYTLGVEISREFGHELRNGYFMPIINRNTTIPCSRVERVSTIRPNQTHVEIKIYQGESRRVEGNLLLGELELHGIPRGPAGQPVDIRFTYDLNGVLEVEATIVETKKKVSQVITRLTHGMTPQTIAQAVVEMQHLKHHPREDAVNRLLLRRAERLYQELSIDHRQMLEQLLSGFEEALELRDAGAIDRHRQAVEEFLEFVDPQSGDSRAEPHGDG